MFQKLIDNFVSNLKKDDVNEFALKNGIVLNENELLYVYNIVKKDYRTIIYGNPDPIFSDLREKFSIDTVNKAEKLYLDFKTKYGSYL